jgi:hypothetical protein
MAERNGFSMALSPELSRFCNNWRTKAETYSIETVGGAFDRFFTLYVIFNRLYAEATFRLARRGHVKLSERYFPDSKGAQEYVLQFCRAERLANTWEHEPNTSTALRQISDHLRQGRFHLKLDMATGAPNPDADRDLLAKLESRSRNLRAKGVLEALYAIRCNMFHGHKDFRPVQLVLLEPAIVVLDSTVGILLRALDQNAG